MKAWEIHPELVVFPIAFLVGGVGLDLYSLARRRPAGRLAATSLLRAGTWLGLAAAAAGVLAYFTVPAHTEQAHELMYWHLGGMAVALVLFAVIVRRRGRLHGTLPGPLLTTSGVIAALVLIASAHLGGTIVFRGGAGIDPSILAPEVRSGHHHDSEHEHGEGHEHAHEPEPATPLEHGEAESRARADAAQGKEHEQGKEHAHGAEPEPAAPHEHGADGSRQPPIAAQPEAHAQGKEHEHGPEPQLPARHQHEGAQPEPSGHPAGEARVPQESSSRPPRPIEIPPEGLPPGQPGKDYTPVVTPNGAALPWKIVDGVKVFHLVAEEVEHEFAPGLKARCWGYNGRVHGPTIEAVEGDRVRIYVTNHLPEATSVHWHGILLPNGMDGVSGLTQQPIRPGETFKYEFTLRQHGTHMYHPHLDEMTQMAMGMMGLFVIHPRTPPSPKIDRDFAILLSEWRITPGMSRPDPNEMTDFNVITLNGVVFPATWPLVAKLGDRVRIRFANLSAMDHHPMHLHGYQFRIVESDGGQIPESAQQVETTVLVQVGSSKTIEFVAEAAGDWALHCHMTHHLMNQMGHGIPIMLGVDTKGLEEKMRQLLPGYMTMGQTGIGEMGAMDMPVPRNSIPMLEGEGPFGPITMGGMFTILKVREGITSYEDPGYYAHPAGTVAGVAKASDLERDGIHAAPAPAEARPAEPHQHGKGQSR